MDLRGRVALVTGAGTRLGRAIAAALADRGMRLAIHYHHSSEGAESLRDDVVAKGGEARLFQSDLTDPIAARTLPETVAAACGGLDVLVNSAAVMERLSFEETTPEQYDSIMALNLRAVFFCTQGAVPALRAAHGKVINIADLAGLEPWPAFAVHSVSKAGVVMLTEVMARALAPDVTVNAVAPGPVLVPESAGAEERDALIRTTPLKRLGSPGDAVAAILYLLERGDYVTGETLVVDGGRRIR
jgi:pteridine reductase